MTELRIFAARCALVEPVHQEGVWNDTDLYVADPYDRHTPFVLCRVRTTHPACRMIHVGELLIVKPHSFERFTWNGSDHFLMHENNALAVVQEEQEALAKSGA